MSKLGNALRDKFKSPKDALRALGLDESLIAAGADVVVGDSMENFLMSKKAVMSRKALFVAGAVLGILAPKMALDAQVDISPLFAGLTAKNYNEKKPALLAGLKKALEGKLAQDESIEDVVALLDKLGGVKTGEDDLDANAGALPTVMPDDTSMDEDDDAEKKRMEFLKGKLSAEDMATYDSMIGKAKDAAETPEEKAAREKKESYDKAARDAEMPKAMTEKAMDEKLKQVALDVRATERGIQEALRRVRPLVGELAIAFDSAEEVYRHVLKMKGVKAHDTMHADALPMALDMQIEKASTKRVVVAPAIAADEASDKNFTELFGKGAGEHIRLLG